MSKKKSYLVSFISDLISISTKLCSFDIDRRAILGLLDTSVNIKHSLTEALSKEFITPIDREDLALCSFMIHNLNCEIAELDIFEHAPDSWVGVLITHLKDICTQLLYYAEDLGKITVSAEDNIKNTRLLLKKCRTDILMGRHRTVDVMCDMLFCSDVYCCIKKAISIADCFTYIALKNS